MCQLSATHQSIAAVVGIFERKSNSMCRCSHSRCIIVSIDADAKSHVNTALLGTSRLLVIGELITVEHKPLPDQAKLRLFAARLESRLAGVRCCSTSKRAASAGYFTYHRRFHLFDVRPPGSFTRPPPLSAAPSPAYDRADGHDFQRTDVSCSGVW